MIAHDRLESGNTWHDPFGPAAETGKEMRFDKAGDDADVGFD